MINRFDKEASTWDVKPDRLMISYLYWEIVSL